jgi:hypothetical protein
MSERGQAGTLRSPSMAVMRAPTWQERVNDAVRDIYEQAARQPAIRVLDMLGLSDIAGVAEEMNRPNTGLKMGIMPEGPGKTLKEIATRVEKPIKAYHGSPHDFDQFSLSKIGTGEGAQAYGHGLYFAENEGVAKGYRDQLSGIGDDLVVRDGNRVLRGDAIDDIGLDAVKFLEMGRKQAGQFPHNTAYYAKKVADSAAQGLPGAAKRNEAVKARIEEWANAKIGYEKNPGRMYEVNIHADPDTFLDWDKPLSQQPKQVQAVLRPDPSQVKKLQPKGTDAAILKQALRASEGTWADLDMVIDNDRQLYTAALDLAKREGLTEEALDHAGDSVGSWFVKKHRAYVDLMKPSDDVSRMVKGREQDLKSAGVPGIKYLDHGSRAAGEGSRNYVVFDDKLIEIVKKYGIAGAIGAGLINEAQARQMRAQGYQ